MLSPFDLFAIIVITLTQRFVYRDILRTGFVARRTLAAAYILLAGAFALGFSFLTSRFALPPQVALVAGAVGQTWFFGSTAGYLLWRGFRLATSRARKAPFDPERRRLLNATGAALAAAPFALVGYGALVERLDFRVREVDVPIPNLPHDLDGLRLVHLSDIHLSAFLSERDLARVIDSANELRAHLAFVTGDLITAAGDPLDTCLRQLARLRTDAGVLACMGNHERYANAEDYTERQAARLGLPFLRSQTRQLRFGSATLNVAGVDYQRKGHYLPGAERMVVPGAVNLLMSHNPDVFPVAAKQGYDLMLSGHTHGGQVTVEILHESLSPARFVTPFVYGLFREGAAHAYVTRGIGTIGIPARIGAPPEIALLRLRKA